MQPSVNEWPEEFKEVVSRAQKETYHETDIEALRESAYAKLPKNHLWQQRGPYIICTSCKPQHSQHIGTTKNLTRLEDGNYVLTDRF